MRKYWSEEEILKLIDLVEKDHTVDYISSILDRGEVSIRSKLNKLGIKYRRRWRKEITWVEVLRNKSIGFCWECTSHATRNGYPVFMRNKKNQALHRHMYEKYKGEIGEGLFVRHKCDNPLCINPDHLEVGNQVDNMRDCKERGRSAIQEKHGRSKLTEIQIKEIRELHSSKILSMKELAKKYNISYSHITDIIKNKYWKGV